MNNWENNHRLNNAAISSPYANTMSTPEAYYSPNQNQMELIKTPIEHWYQQQQQRGISPSSSGISREDSFSPCSTPMYNLDDAQLMNTSSVSSSSYSPSSHYIPLIDPMVFGNSNKNSSTAVASTISSSSQHQSAYQQPMMMPLLQHETHSNHEKLFSHYSNHGSLMVPTVHSNVNTYITYNLRSPTSPVLSNMYAMNSQNGMSSNNMYVSYQNGYTNHQVMYNNNNNNNHAEPTDHSLSTHSIHQKDSNQQQYHNYEQNTITNHPHQNTYAYTFSPQNNVKYAQQQQQQQQKNKHNSHHQQNNHLMTTTTTTSEANTSTASSPSTSSSYSSSSSSSNIINGATSIIRHKQNNSNQNNNNDQNSFPCLIPECNKLFSRPYNLKSHMRTHTHERPYECTYKPCAWKFARPHDLKRHELQHTGQKPHGCRFCHRKFARSDALKRHWKVDLNCAQALKQETALNGGNQVQMRRKKSKKIIKQ